MRNRARPRELPVKDSAQCGTSSEPPPCRSTCERVRVLRGRSGDGWPSAGAPAENVFSAADSTAAVNRAQPFTIGPLCRCACGAAPYDADPSMTLLEWCQWLQDSAVGMAISSSAYLYPAIEGSH